MKDANTLRMEQCPKFPTCSIPKCPLDELMSERTELDKDEICPLRRLTEGKKKVGKLKGVVLSAKIKKLVKIIPEKNFKKPKR